jgi:hypothetical protein
MGEEFGFLRRPGGVGEGREVMCDGVDGIYLWMSWFYVGGGENLI